MTHFVGLVVADNVQELNSILAKYDESLHVEPYFKAMSDGDILSMAKYYGIDADDYLSLVEKMNDWQGYDGVIINNKLGYMSTYNPESQWDWYSIGGRWEGIVPENKCNLNDASKYFSDHCKTKGWDEYSPSTIVTKDGWFSSKDWGWFGCYSEIEDGENTLLKVIEENKDKNCYVVDFHI